MKCALCEDCGWVCETHQDKPHACACGAPGAACNTTNDATAPRMPDGFKTEVDKDGWRH